MTRMVYAALVAAFLALSLWVSRPKPAADLGLRSTDLEQVVTVEGDVERTVYLREGAPAKPAEKRYASITKTRTGDQVLEEYFDLQGQPALQQGGHYALLREYDREDRNYKVTYLDAQGQPTNSSGRSLLLRTYDREGKVRFERYYDVKGSLVSGRYYQYGEDGCTFLVYLDREGMPDARQSSPILKRYFYGEGPFQGKVEREWYFGIDGQPLAKSAGQYGVQYEYDDLGRTAAITYLGLDGAPMKIKQGYATVKRTFRPDDSVESERYYDAEGQPAALSSGQYGYRRSGGKTIYLDRNGRDIFDLDDFLYSTPLAVTVIGLLTACVALALDRRGNRVLLVLYLLFIVKMTLLGRRFGVDRAVPAPLWSYRQFFTNRSLQKEILYNIWLFFPLGSILYRLRPQKRTLWAVLLLSVLIETIQYCFGLGLAEFDDLLSNGLGGLLGFGLGLVLGSPWRRGKRERALQ